MLSPVMVLTITVLFAAAPAAPPPWPESLDCAALTQAASELHKDPVTGIPAEPEFDHAMFWSFAAMDAARLAGLSSAQAEADQKTERARIKPLLAAGDPGAKARLAACVAQVPPI
ncbi:MAG TPA: hypothetical protein PLO65_14865 [Caulobacter sp.]|nr:hypothetical protein [Caulobacter sp.]